MYDHGYLPASPLPSCHCACSAGLIAHHNLQAPLPLLCANVFARVDRLRHPGHVICIAHTPYHGAACSGSTCLDSSCSSFACSGWFCSKLRPLFLFFPPDRPGCFRLFGLRFTLSKWPFNHSLSIIWSGRQHRLAFQWLLLQNKLSWG